MDVITKRYIIYGIFYLSAIGWAYAVIPFMWRPQDEISVLVRFSAFAVFITGLLFLQFITRLSVKRFNLNDKKNQRRITPISKILLTISICEFLGLATLALFFWGGSLLGDVKAPSPILIVCLISCLFTLGFCHELLALSPSVLIPIAFFVQFVIYAIIGLIISIFVCRKKSPPTTQ